MVISFLKHTSLKRYRHRKKIYDLIKVMNVINLGIQAIIVKPNVSVSPKATHRFERHTLSSLPAEESIKKARELLEKEEEHKPHLIEKKVFLWQMKRHLDLMQKSTWEFFEKTLSHNKEKASQLRKIYQDWKQHRACSHFSSQNLLEISTEIIPTLLSTINLAKRKLRRAKRILGQRKHHNILEQLSQLERHLKHLKMTYLESMLARLSAADQQKSITYDDITANLYESLITTGISPKKTFFPIKTRLITSYHMFYEFQKYIETHGNAQQLTRLTIIQHNLNAKKENFLIHRHNRSFFVPKSLRNDISYTDSWIPFIRRGKTTRFKFFDNNAWQFLLAFRTLNQNYKLNRFKPNKPYKSETFSILKLVDNAICDAEKYLKYHLNRQHWRPFSKRTRRFLSVADNLLWEMRATHMEAHAIATNKLILHLKDRWMEKKRSGTSETFHINHPLVKHAHAHLASLEKQINFFRTKRRSYSGIAFTYFSQAKSIIGGLFLPPNSSVLIASRKLQKLLNKTPISKKALQKIRDQYHSVEFSDPEHASPFFDLVKKSHAQAWTSIQSFMKSNFSQLDRRIWIANTKLFLCYIKLIRIINNPDQISFIDRIVNCWLQQFIKLVKIYFESDSESQTIQEDKIEFLYNLIYGLSNDRVRDIVETLQIKMGEGKSAFDDAARTSETLAHTPKLGEISAITR